MSVCACVCVLLAEGFKKLNLEWREGNCGVKDSRHHSGFSGVCWGADGGPWSVSLVCLLVFCCCLFGLETVFKTAQPCNMHISVGSSYLKVIKTDTGFSEKGLGKCRSPPFCLQILTFKGKEIEALSGVTFFASKTKVSLVSLFAPGTSPSRAVWARS